MWRTRSTASWLCLRRRLIIEHQIAAVVSRCVTRNSDWVVDHEKPVLDRRCRTNLLMNFAWCSVQDHVTATLYVTSGALHDVWLATTPRPRRIRRLPARRSDGRQGEPDVPGFAEPGQPKPSLVPGGDTAPPADWRPLPS
jgi:hypothetical protein